jgi:hypothetical protein
MPTNRQRWEGRCLQMMKCKSASALVARYGEPPHKVQSDGFEIWHYPLGIASGTLYSIHVCVQPDQSARAYMHMEPSNAPDTPQPAWWKFWV